MYYALSSTLLYMQLNCMFSLQIQYILVFLFNFFFKKWMQLIMSTYMCLYFIVWLCDCVCVRAGFHLSKCEGSSVPSLLPPESISTEIWRSKIQWAQRRAGKGDGHSHQRVHILSSVFVALQNKSTAGKAGKTVDSLIRLGVEVSRGIFIWVQSATSQLDATKFNTLDL